MLDGGLWGRGINEGTGVGEQKPDYELNYYSYLFSCANNFSEEEMEVLHGYLAMVEEYECLKAQLEHGCSAYLTG